MPSNSPSNEKMDSTIKEALSRGKRVGLAVKPFEDEVTDFTPLAAAVQEAAAIVVALEEKEATMDVDDTAPTTGKDQEREKMARATEALSNRMVAYALIKGDLKLKQQFSLSYTDVRFGDADADVNDVRELVKLAQALPEKVQLDYKITDALIKAPEDAAKAFEDATDEQTTTKADARLARLSAPELVTQLRRQLEIIRRLLTGMKSEGGRWADFYTAFRDANKVRQEAAERQVPQAPRVVKRINHHRQDASIQRLDKQNYGPAYELEIKNVSPSDLLLWMGFEKNPAPTGTAPATAFRCPAGKTTTMRRDALGEELARYLTGKFVEVAGGEVRIRVRRVVE